MKGGTIVKKNLLVILSSFAIFSLISCNEPKHIDNGSSSHPILITTSKDDTSSKDPISSNEPISSNDPISSSEDVVSASSDVSSNSIENETYYHVVFVNYDESVLYEVDVLKGSEALYSGETPTKAEDDEFTYEFIGWDKELTDIQSNTTFIAQFKAVAKEGWGPIIWF